MCYFCKYPDLWNFKHLLGIVQLFVPIYKSEQHSDFGGLVGLRKVAVRILVQEIIRTPGNPIINLKCTDFFGREYSDLAGGGSAKIQTLFGCVNQHYKLLDDPLGSLSNPFVST